jgi:hypothetical protein
MSQIKMRGEWDDIVINPIGANVLHLDQFLFFEYRFISFPLSIHYEKIISPLCIMFF